jgi:hypothetical protein
MVEEEEELTVEHKGIERIRLTETDGVNMIKNIEFELGLINKIQNLNMSNPEGYKVETFFDGKEVIIQSGKESIIKKCRFKNKICALKTIKTNAKNLNQLPELKDRRYMSEMVFWLSVQNLNFVEPEEFEEFMTLSHEDRLKQKKIAIGIVPLYHIFFYTHRGEDAGVSINFVMPYMDGSGVELHQKTKKNPRKGESEKEWVNHEFYDYIKDSRNDYIDLCMFYCFAGLDRIHNNDKHTISRAYSKGLMKFIHGNIDASNILYKLGGGTNNPTHAQVANISNIAFFLCDFGLSTQIDENGCIKEQFDNNLLYNENMRPTFLLEMDQITDLGDIPFTKNISGGSGGSGVANYRLKQNEIENKKEYGITNIMDFTPMARLLVYLRSDQDKFFFKNRQIAKWLELDVIGTRETFSLDMYKLEPLLFAFAAMFPDDDIKTHQRDLVSYYNMFCKIFESNREYFDHNMKHKTNIYMRYVYFLILPYELRPTISEIINLIQ